jgi:F420-dependent oxidoreductase-like protein
MREYIDALAPLLRGENVSAKGERVTAISTSPLGPRETRTPGLLIAALGPKMLHLAGSSTDGTLLWLTGPKTIASHVAPTIRAAAAQAGRPEPRIVCALPMNVTNDIPGARERINTQLATYATLPSYAKMMAQEGAREPADVALLGSREQVLEQLDELANAGVTEFSGAPTGTAAEREAALDVLVEYGASHP